jgi:hypothetical protein
MVVVRKEKKRGVMSALIVGFNRRSDPDCCLRCRLRAARAPT